MYKRNQLKISGAKFSESRRVWVEVLEQFCNRKAFVNSEYACPINVGFTESGEPIIKNLPELGNILLFGETGKTLYDLVFFAQILYVNYELKTEIALFDDAMQTFAPFFGDRDISKYYIGDVEEFSAFLASLEREKARRKREKGKGYPHTIYFAYLDYHSLEDTCNVLIEKLNNRLCEGLQGLGLQLIVCSGNSRPTEFIVPYIDLFDTTIGTKTYRLQEYSGLLGTEGIISHGGAKEKFIYAGYDVPAPDLND